MKVPWKKPYPKCKVCKTKLTPPSGVARLFLNDCEWGCSKCKELRYVKKYDKRK